MPETMAIIPARAGSKGVVDKNIRLLGGKPLLAWSIVACLKSKTIDRVIVSTDSEKYANLALSFGAEVPFLRPSEISGDHATDYDFMLHALDWLKVHSSEPKQIAHIRPTTPLREPELINEAINFLARNPTATAVRSVHEMSESAYKTFELSADGALQCVGSNDTALDMANRARQVFPKTYHANGYIDVLSVSFIRKMRLLHGNNVLPFVTPIVTEVDTEEDFSCLEYKLNQFPNIATKLFE